MPLLAVPSSKLVSAATVAVILTKECKDKKAKAFGYDAQPRTRAKCGGGTRTKKLQFKMVISQAIHDSSGRVPLTVRLTPKPDRARSLRQDPGG